MIYKCIKCGYTSKHKSHFDKHMNKLNPCSNEIVEFDKNKWENENNKNIYHLKSFEELNDLPKQELINIILKLTSE